MENLGGLSDIVMNVLYLSSGTINSIDDFSLLREFVKSGHRMYILSPTDKTDGDDRVTDCDRKVDIIQVYTGKLQQISIIKKGINTLLFEKRFIKAIKTYLSDVAFDLVLYPTPPITLGGVVSYVKKRDQAKTYLMLKDIFPQNAVDLGMLSKSGLKGLIYKYFRRIEKRLYSISDRIGCMSPANLEYLLKHNPEIQPEKVEICPNSAEVRDISLTLEERLNIRQKYGLPANKMIFVYGGNLGRPQGIPFIIECLKLQIGNPDTFYLIVGNGTEFSKLEGFFRKSRPTNMKLMERLPKDEYDRVMAACDVGMIFLDHCFTIPNFPSRLLCYMQARLPVLACTDPYTDIGKVIVDGGFGWWCESDDANSFGRLVDTAREADRVTMGENAFIYLKQHWDVDKQFRELYKSICDTGVREKKNDS